MGDEQSELENRLGERTLVLCKPEAVLLGDHPKILQSIHDLKLTTPLLRMFSFTDASILDFYASVVDKRTAGGAPREDVENSYKMMTGKPTLAVVVQGINSIAAMRKLAGAVTKKPTSNDTMIISGVIQSIGYDSTFEPIRALPGTIRGDLSTEDKTIANLMGKAQQNYMHASDSKKSYQAEIEVLIKHEHISNKDFIGHDHASWHVLGYRK